MRWRMGGDVARFWNLSYSKLALLDAHHGQPTGMFSADEHFGGRHPSRGVELCVVVEMMHSLVRAVHPRRAPPLSCVPVVPAPPTHAAPPPSLVPIMSTSAWLFYRR